MNRESVELVDLLTTSRVDLKIGGGPGEGEGEGEVARILMTREKDKHEYEGTGWDVPRSPLGAIEEVSRREREILTG